MSAHFQSLLGHKQSSPQLFAISKEEEAEGELLFDEISSQSSKSESPQYDFESEHESLGESENKIKPILKGPHEEKKAEKKVKFVIKEDIVPPKNDYIVIESSIKCNEKIKNQRKFKIEN